MGFTKDGSRIVINDLTGGINDWDAPVAVEDNQVVSALNVDYRAGNIGTRRRGLFGTGQLTGSVFERHVPTFGNSGQNHWNANSGNVTVPASGYSSGTNAILICLISTLGTLSAAPTFNGLAMTLINTATQGAFTIYAYRWSGVDLAGGTVAITTTGAVRTCAWAGYFNEVDTAVSPVSAGTQAFGAAANAFDYSSNNFTEQFLVVTGISHAGNTSTYTAAVGRASAGSELDVGNVTLGWEFKIGMKPTTWFRNSMTGAAGVAVASFFGLKGRTVTTESSLENSLRVIMRHTPTDDISGDEVWAWDSRGRIDRKTPGGGWQNGVNRQNWFVGSTVPQGDASYYTTNGSSVHQKFFLALDGILYNDRLHVWDGTVLRHVGFSPGDPPSAADTAGAGTFAGTRYYRVRYIQKSGSVILRRGEPSAVVTFTPSGVNVSATITRPALRTFGSGVVGLVDEGETDWELEASTDNITFYLIATMAIGTATVVDATTLATPAASTYTAFPASPVLTEYNPIPAARHVTVDDDRVLAGGSPAGLLIGLGSWVMSNDSRVNWTPLRADTGVGNDERVPATARFFQDLDGVNSGRLTFLSPAAMGGVWALKEARIYKLGRTGGTPAYSKFQYSDTRGCFMRAACTGTDLQGNPVVYFIDPNVGPARLDTSGVKDLMRRRQLFSALLNRTAAVQGRVLFYPAGDMVWFSIAASISQVPSYMFVWNLRTDSWTDYTGQAGSMLSGVVLPTVIFPYFVPSNRSTANLLTIADFGSNDDGTTFVASITTKAYSLGAHFQEFKIDGAVLHAKTGLNANYDVMISAVRDTGIEQKDVTGIDLTTPAGGQYVTKELDAVGIGECKQVTFVFQDNDSATQGWTLEALTARVGDGSEVG